MKKRLTRFIGIILLVFLTACGSTGEADSTVTLNSIEAVPTSTYDFSNVPTDPEEAALVDESLRIVTPIPTDTPIPTNTLVPTATPFSAENFPQDVPESFAYDLVWVQGGALLRWDAHNSEVFEVVGMGPDAQIQVERPVVHAEVHEDGKAVVVLAEQEENTYSLALVDVWDYSWQELVTVQSQEDYPSFSLSPDGKWLGYFNLLYAFTSSKFPSYYYEFQVLNLETEDVNSMGVCVDDWWNWQSWCEKPVVWSPNSEQVAWHGYSGAWAGTPEDFWFYSAEAMIMVQPDLIASDERHVLAVPNEWSQDGKFLLVDNTHWEGYRMVAVNVESGIIEFVPNTMGCAGCGEHQVKILKDNRLFVFYIYEDGQATLSLYQFVDTDERVLSLSRENQIDFDEYHYPVFITQLSQSELLVLMKMNQYTDESYYAVMRINLNSLEITSISAPLTVPTDWWDNLPVFSSDGSWLFVPDEGKLISTDVQYTFDLSSVLTEDAADFTFVPRGE